MKTEKTKQLDKMIQKARLAVGDEKQVRNQYNEIATKDAIKHYAWGYGDLNPLWLEEDYAKSTSWGNIIAPPTFPLSTHWGPQYPTNSPGSKGMGLPGLFALYTGVEFTFHEPIRVNESVQTIKKAIGIVDSSGRVDGDLIEPSVDFDKAFRYAGARWGAFEGRMVDQVHQFKTYASGKLVAVAMQQVVRVEHGAIAVNEGKYRDLALPKYTREDLERICEAYEREFLRGRDVLYWEDVNVGDTLPAIVKGPLTVNSMVVFLMGAGSPFGMTDRAMHLYLRRFPGANILDSETNVPDVPERAHWDTLVANSLGWPRGYDFGQQVLCALGQLVTNWMGDDALLRTLTFWRVRPWFLYETMWVYGRVAAKDKTAEGALAYIDLWTETAEGDRICDGSASVALKTRS